MNRCFSRLVIVSLIVSVTALSAFAQHARISGKVTDPHGAVITNAEIQVIDHDTARKATTMTDKTGAYIMGFLPAGTYQVSVKAPGFRSAVSDNIVLAEDQALVHDVQLTIGSVQSSVNVKDRIESIPNANPEVAVGPWTDTKLQDLPYSITVIPSTLIDNVQAYQIEDIAKLIPQITNLTPIQNNNGNPTFYVRGFPVSAQAYSSMTLEGLVGGAGGVLSSILEDKERVELLSGTDGFLYGMGSIGGSLNYVLKRPTETPHYSVIAGDNAGANGYVALDATGPIDKNGILGYRINGVEQNGPTSIEYQSIKRDLLSGALDIHLHPNLLVQLNYTHSDYDTSGDTPGFSLKSGLTAWPKAPDPSKIFTAPWLHFPVHTNTGGVKTTYNINKTFTLRSFYDYTYQMRPETWGETLQITDLAGDIKQSFGCCYNPNPTKTHSLYTFLDANFKTFGMRHKVTLGINDAYSDSDDTTTQIQFATNSFTSNLYNETLPAEPGFTSTAVTRYPVRTVTGNYLIGDDISFGKFHVLAGVNEVIYKFHVFQAPPNSALTFAPTLSYDTHKATPTVAFTYKPVNWLMTYASYQQSLQKGSLVTNLANYTNANTLMPPTVSNQGEIGVKLVLRPNVLLTAALFDLHEALQYTQDNGYLASNGQESYTVVQSGRENHKGLELTASGKVRRDFTLIAGATFLDPKIANTPATPYEEGEKPSGVSTVSGKLYGEYDLPRVRGLVVIGGMRYIGSWYSNIPTTSATPHLSLPAYTVEDMGLRYTVNIAEQHALTFRLNVNNLTDKAYWQATSYVGAPRTFLTTAQYSF
jgi:iron complex outermembrane recepter protein